tara:strand:- start:4 stop:261 length:258 start_codon:yes stop_codon:yes gene_type:complete
VQGSKSFAVEPADNLITTTVPADCLNPNSSTIGLSVAELIQLILRCADGYCHNGDSSWKEGTFSLGKITQQASLPFRDKATESKY